MNAKLAKSVTKFIEDYNKTVAEHYGEENRESALAEDESTFYTLNIKVLKTKIKFETEYHGFDATCYEESESDDDEIREWLKKWRADMRRAIRYWQMDSEKLDAIQNGEAEDDENDDED